MKSILEERSSYIVFCRNSVFNSFFGLPNWSQQSEVVGETRNIAVTISLHIQLYSRNLSHSF